MIGEHVNKNEICPTCGGYLHAGLAAIPFILDNNAVIVIKNAPSKICDDCYEPFVNGKATDQILALLNQLKHLQSEISVVAYSQYEMA